MLTFCKTIGFAGVKSGTSALKAYYTIGSAFTKLLPSSMSVLAKPFSIASASVTGLFSFASRAPAIYASYQEASEKKYFKKNYLVMTLSGLSILGSAFTSWYALVYILPEGIGFELLAILPALVSLKSFTSYNLNKALKNLELFVKLYRENRLSKKNLLIVCILTLLAATGYTSFNFFLTSEAQDFLYPDFESRSVVIVALSSLLNAGTFFVTLLSGPGSVARYHLGEDEINLTELFNSKQTSAQIPALFFLSPLNIYEFSSAVFGYTISSLINLNKTTWPFYCKLPVSFVIAVSAGYVDLIFTQREATANIIKCLPDKPRKKQNITHSGRHKAGFWSCCNPRTETNKALISNQETNSLLESNPAPSINSV
jgi:hypothetical protein